MNWRTMVSAAVLGGVCAGLAAFVYYRNGNRRLRRDRSLGGSRASEVGGFEGAAARVANYRGALTDTVRLQLYGLYKQGTSGPCSTERPGMVDVVGRAKWDAWNSVRMLSKEEARARYEEVVRQSLPKSGGGADTREARAIDGIGDSFSGFGAPSIYGTLLISPPELEDDKQEADTPATPQDALPEDAIHELAKQGDLKAIEALLETGVDINYTDSDGRTALYWAADSGMLNVVLGLVKKGADPTLQDTEGTTALHCAAICEHEQICRALLLAGAKADQEDNFGETPQHLFLEEWDF